MTALLGEADLLTGQLECPRSPPDALARFTTETVAEGEEWVVPGVCAYVPQVSMPKMFAFAQFYKVSLVCVAP